MVFDGRTWQSLGRWAAERGLSKTNLRRSLTTGGRVLGRILIDDPHAAIQVRRVRGMDVLVRQVAGNQWLYLPNASDAGARRGAGNGT